jgi:hypothetical protein
MKIQVWINGCIAIEKVAAEIYSAFMKMFPEESGFWENLYHEELDHIESFQLGELLGLFGDEEGDLPLTEMPYIVKTLEFTENLKEQIRHSALTLEQALRMSLTLEESMVESLMNDIKEKAREQFPGKLEEVLLEERTHVEKITQLMIKKGFLKES